uniref:DnaJ heat shock protein family (Hsp40) member C24 n=1 Tax=Laticauda laticaudata TaxID=8630 RepID=A0A8C5SBQ2_LATLA
MVSKHLTTDLLFIIDSLPSLLFLFFFFFFLFSLSFFDWQYHPDKQSTDVPAGEAEARMQRFIEIDRAWKILGNEETKKEYDLQRRGRFLPRSAVVAAAALNGSKVWE